LFRTHPEIPEVAHPRSLRVLRRPVLWVRSMQGGQSNGLIDEFSGFRGEIGTMSYLKARPVSWRNQ
jgi:hypothetical protein